MFSLMSPLTKGLGVALLVLIALLWVSEKSRRSAFKELGATGVVVESQKRQLDMKAAEIDALLMALDASKAEIAKNEALLVANEASRKTLETRVTTLTQKLDRLGGIRYAPPTQLCPSDERQPTLDDLLDAPLPAELADWLRMALAQTRAGGAGGQGDATRAPAAPLPLPGGRSDDAASGTHAPGGDGR